jgi:Fe-S-cluster-containing hydrogenase component 2
MTKVFCPRYCPVPYCEPVCPTNAIRISDQKVEVIPALCIGCGLCRKSCMTWSLEKPLEHKSVQWMMRDSKEPVAEAL